MKRNLIQFRSEMNFILQRTDDKTNKKLSIYVIASIDISRHETFDLGGKDCACIYLIEPLSVYVSFFIYISIEFNIILCEITMSVSRFS